MTTLDPKDCSPDEWLNAIKLAYRSEIDQMLTNNAGSYDAVATAWVSKVGPENTFAFGVGGAARNFFEQVKHEFNKFLCGDDSYEDLRKKVKQYWKKNNTTVVMTIAIVIGTKISIAAAVLTPVIALLLAAASQIGLASWCAGK